MLKLKLQYLGHLMQRTDSLEKTLMLGKIEDRRRRGRQRMRWLDGITDLMDNHFKGKFKESCIYETIRNTQINLLNRYKTGKTVLQSTGI